MSAFQSNLSAPEYGYDMVVATTEDSINATIKQYLLNYDGKEFVSCYKQTSPDEYEPMDYDEVLRIAGMDPFTIPDTKLQNEQQKEAVKRLYDAYFAFAFRADMGIPDGYPLAKIPGVVVFDKPGSEVRYNLFFRNMSILNIDESTRFGFSWVNVQQAYSQEQENPWVFQFRVNLDLNADDTGSVFGTLPEEVQKKVKNLNPDSAFSVQQLYLDLNTALLSSDPTIIGLDKSSKAYIYLTEIFIQNYYDTLKKGAVSPGNPNGNFLLGYAIQPVNPNLQAPSIIPTDLNIMVSPYWDDRGIATDNFGKYTLNYLVMTKDNRMPPAVPFKWNWVDDSQSSGVMVIKKGIFAGFLLQQLSPSLQSICLVPTVSVHCNAIEIKWSWGFTYDTDPQYYKLVDDGTPKVLTFHYDKDAYDEDQWLYNVSNMETRVTIDSDIYLEDNIIRSVTTANVYIRINIEGGVTEGNVVTYTTETSYEIGISADGELSAKMTPDSPKFTDNSQQINPSGWSKFVTFGQINDLISDIKSMWTTMQSFLEGHDKSIESMLNNSGVWVFPGGKTFAFKEASFSNFQDLTALVTYVEPEDSALLKIKD